MGRGERRDALPRTEDDDCPHSDYCNDDRDRRQKRLHDFFRFQQYSPPPPTDDDGLNKDRLTPYAISLFLTLFQSALPPPIHLTYVVAQRRRKRRTQHSQQCQNLNECQQTTRARQPHTATDGRKEGRLSRAGRRSLPAAVAAETAARAREVDSAQPASAHI